ncbi:MAG: tetratricopeptide repeat protein [Deltaproteobacteria bacterium]|nr:tetratricopeptide repeat protein [Deltaproteobacteria bacterium]
MLEEALRFYNEALDINKKIGRLLGQANALVNIGLVYAEQGKKHEGLELLRQARAIYLKIGARTGGYHTVEKMIERFNAN